MSFEKLIKAARRRPLFVPGATTHEVHLGLEELERILPHRPPFRFIDSISAVDMEEQAAIGHRGIPGTRSIPVSSSSKPWPSSVCA